MYIADRLFIQETGIISLSTIIKHGEFTKHVCAIPINVGSFLMLQVVH